MDILSSAILLFLILDPFGNIPIFLSTLKNVAPRRRNRVVIRELLIALAVLLTFLFAGPFLLDLLNISDPSLSVTGGVLLFLIAIRMVFPPRAPSPDEHVDEEPFIVPLAVPLVAGPSALATVLLIASGDAHNWPYWLLAVVLAWLAASILLIIGAQIANFLGHRGLVAMERLMGMLLVAIAIEMTLSGIQAFIQSHAQN